VRYYKLMYDYDNDTNYIGCKKTDLLGKSEYIVTNGKCVHDWNDDIVLDYNPDEGNQFTDYLANVYGWLIFSEKFIELSNKYTNDSIQYLGLKIRNIISNEVISSYKIANIVDVIDAIDMEHSVYDEFELDDEKIISIEKYALKGNMVKGHHIFKLKDDTIPTFISEDLKDIIETNQLTGFSFLEVKIV